MKLRIASHDDLEIFMQLYEDASLDQVYILAPPKATSDSSPCDEDKWLEALQYKPADFEKDFPKKYILMVEHEKKIIGCFRISYISAGKCKLGGWAITPKYLAYKEVIWDTFLKFVSNHYKRVKEIEVIVPDFYSSVSWFKSHGFSNPFPTCFRLSIRDQRKGSTI